jgi:hypothetical protein
MLYVTPAIALVSRPGLAEYTRPFGVSGTIMRGLCRYQKYHVSG